jgi:hypothetical protein
MFAEATIHGSTTRSIVAAHPIEIGLQRTGLAVPLVEIPMPIARQEPGNRLNARAAISAVTGQAERVAEELAIVQVPQERAIEPPELGLEERGWAIDRQAPELEEQTALGAGIFLAAAVKTGTPSVAGQGVIAVRAHAPTAVVVR